MAEKGDQSDQVSLPPTYAPSETYTESPPPAYRKDKANAVQIVRMICFTIIAACLLIGFFVVASSWISSRPGNKAENRHEEPAALKSAGFASEPDLPKVQPLVDLDNNKIENDIIQMQGKFNPTAKEAKKANESDTPDQALQTLEKEATVIEEEMEDEEERLESSIKDAFQNMRKIKLPFNILGKPPVSNPDVKCRIEKRQRNIAPGLMTKAVMVVCGNDNEEESSDEMLQPPPEPTRLGHPFSLFAPIMKMLAARAKARSEMPPSGPQLISVAGPIPINSMPGPIIPMLRPIRPQDFQEPVPFSPMASPVIQPFPQNMPNPNIQPLPEPFVPPMSQPMAPSGRSMLGSVHPNMNRQFPSPPFLPMSGSNHVHAPVPNHIHPMNEHNFPPVPLNGRTPISVNSQPPFPSFRSHSGINTNHLGPQIIPHFMQQPPIPQNEDNSMPVPMNNRFHNSFLETPEPEDQSFPFPPPPPPSLPQIIPIQEIKKIILKPKIMEESNSPVRSLKIIPFPFQPLKLISFSKSTLPPRPPPLEDAAPRITEESSMPLLSPDRPMPDEEELPTPPQHLSFPNGIRALQEKLGLQRPEPPKPLSFLSLIKNPPPEEPTEESQPSPFSFFQFPRRIRLLRKMPVDEENDSDPLTPLTSLPQPRGALPFSGPPPGEEPFVKPLPDATGRALPSPVALPPLRLLPGHLLRLPTFPLPPFREIEEKMATHMEFKEPEIMESEDPQHIHLSPGQQDDSDFQPQIPDFAPLRVDFGPPKVHTVIGVPQPQDDMAPPPPPPPPPPPELVRSQVLPHLSDRVEIRFPPPLPPHPYDVEGRVSVNAEINPDAEIIQPDAEYGPFTN